MQDDRNDQILGDERFFRMALVALVFGLVVLASDTAGIPEKLPGTAFGWVLLFHFLRASALLGVVGVVLLVGYRATRGEFPIKFGNVEYAVKEAAQKAEGATEAQEQRLRLLEAEVFGIPPQP
jgi:hypothetical protein